MIERETLEHLKREPGGIETVPPCKGSSNLTLGASMTPGASGVFATF